ncbi:hypothetical protein E3N88_45483 [Mikania micrantha]|uniref:WAT1-related protein n=1 Tax=Mikania micrantha TaxID=192012 RepID=A0A5N6LBE6_9ASTR|nr:hypothetical protein E3N88_45483 [Mikania micrantha]
MTHDRWPRYIDQGKLYLGVLFLQLGYAFNGVIVKAALNKGLNPCTFSVYRNIAAVIVFGPFAFYFERRMRPQMTLSVFLKIMLLAQLEPVLDQILYYTGMKYTTATFAIAMCNIIPALTFFMAWIFRLETVNIKKSHSQAKIVGTLVTVGGAMVMTLINGAPIPLPWTGVSRVHQPLAMVAASQDQHIKGAIMITAGCVFWASFFILQGIIRSGASYYVSGLIMKVKGPFFVTAFNPFAHGDRGDPEFVYSRGTNERGKDIGASVIVIGLYLNMG